MIKFSVCIASYNQKDFLKEAIDSVRKQTVPVQLIVVDDGSIDGSYDIARNMAFTVRQVNKGLASARNTGIMHARGEYVLFLDADDILEPTCIEKMQQTAEETNADIIAPEFKTFGVGESVFKYGEIPTIDLFPSGNRLPYFCAIKKAALLETGGYSPRMTWGYEDYHEWFDLLSRGKKIALIREPLVRYRVKEHSMIHDAQAHHEELIAQIKKDFPHVYA